MKYDRPGECRVKTLMMTSAQVVETSVSVITNSPSQNYTHPYDHTSLTYHCFADKNYSETNCSALSDIVNILALKASPLWLIFVLKNIKFLRVTF